eukprot:2483644-Heterocapsa_arctica.AAC.1
MGKPQSPGRCHVMCHRPVTANSQSAGDRSLNNYIIHVDGEVYDMRRGRTHTVCVCGRQRRHVLTFYAVRDVYDLRTLGGFMITHHVS